MDSKFEKNEYQFDKHKGPTKTKLSFAFLKSIQEFSLLIQKKIFTKKLWAYYKLKHYEGTYSPFSYYPTRQTSISSYKSLQRVSFRSDSLFNNQVAGTSKIVSAINRIIQKLKLKSFWKLYLSADPREVIILSNNIDILVNSISRLQQRKYLILKRFAIDNLKITYLIKNRFLSYITTPDSKKRAMSVYITLVNRKQSLILYSFRCISETHLIVQRHQALKALLVIFKCIQSRFKIEAYKIIKNQSILMKKVKDFNILYERIHFIIKIKLTFAFYQVKSFSGRNEIIISRFMQLLNKKHLVTTRFAYNCIKLYVKEYTKRNRSINLENKRIPPKLITLPTIFLSGDPGGGISRKEYYKNLTSKSRSSFIFQ